MENYDIFGNCTVPPEPPSPGRKRYPSMQSIHGIKQGNETCKTCNHCVCKFHHGKIYYKCALWIISHSSATDIRLKNKACNRYEKEKEDAHGKAN